jgi:mono/diheme cytochrome c family protein
VGPLPVRPRLAAAALLLLLLLGGQSAAEPRTDYLLHCMGCHLADGSGTPPGIPALRDRVGYYLQIPGGRDYLLQVPGAANAPLTDVRLAAVLNWVVGEFAGMSAPPDWPPFDAVEVRAARSATPADIDAWRHVLWREIEARFASAPAAY